MITVGIDPGLTGAIAAVHGEILLWVEDMPTIAGEVSPALLGRLYQADQYGPWELHPEHLVAIERVHSMPKQGVSSVFSLGESSGIVRGYMIAKGHRVTRIVPTEWKATFGLNGIGRGLPPAAAKQAKKAASIAKAIELWPAQADLFRLKKHDGRAEAALIALHHARSTSHLYHRHIQTARTELRAVTNGWAEA